MRENLLTLFSSIELKYEHQILLTKTMVAVRIFSISEGILKVKSIKFDKIETLCGGDEYNDTVFT